MPSTFYYFNFVGLGSNIVRIDEFMQKWISIIDHQFPLMITYSTRGFKGTMNKNFNDEIYNIRRKTMKNIAFNIIPALYYHLNRSSFQSCTFHKDRGFQGLKKKYFYSHRSNLALTFGFNEII